MKIKLQWYLQERVILNINLFNFARFKFITFKKKLMGFFDFMTEDIAIDLGTANTLIIHNDKVVIDSPSIVARDRISDKIIAVGKEASLMQG
jgi:actin-like ATPase involved in cell morphogenesis